MILIFLLTVFCSRAFPQHSISPPSLPSWQLEKTKVLKEEGGKKSSDSSSSEIDMLHVDSHDNSGEDAACIE